MGAAQGACGLEHPSEPRPPAHRHLRWGRPRGMSEAEGGERDDGGGQVLYESLVVMYLMTSLPPPPVVHLDDDKDVRAKKHKIYGAALVPALEALAIFKEQFAQSQDVLTVPQATRARPADPRADHYEVADGSAAPRGQRPD
eukprot:763221-Hanusia_phi.AAC.2